MNSRQKTLALIAFLSLISGSLGIVNKIGVQQIPPFGFVASRAILSLIIISPYLYTVNKKLSVRKVKLLLFSLLATANIGTYIVGIKYTNVSVAVVISSAVPTLTVLISYFLYQEKINFRKGLGIILGLIGTGIVALGPLVQKNHLNYGSLYGNSLIFLSAITFSLHTSLSKKAQRQFSPFTITAAFIVVATIVLTPLALWELIMKGNWITSLSPISVGAILYVSIIGTVLFYFLYQKAVKQTSPIITSMMLYLTPIIGICLAVIILGEKITSSVVVGAAFSLIGVWLVTS